MLENKDTKWQSDYDVIVVGFGGAGGSAARFAADNGAKVLIIEAAPYGHEGGNTRYSAQHIAMGHDLQGITEYYRELAKTFSIPGKILNTYMKGLINIPEYLNKYLDVKHPYIGTRDVRPGKPLAAKGQMAEYPELKGHNSFDFALVHDRDFDASLWKIIRQKVIDRKDKIDVWLNSRVSNLIQNPKNKQIDGVEVERNHKKYLIHARKGVVLSLGGFENNAEMQQNFLLDPQRTPLGTLYNRGDGVKMAEDIGAKLWHMDTFENHGIMPGYTFWEGKNKRGRQIKWNLLSNGSIIAVSNDGTRFFNENAKGRHGHVYSHGAWKIPTAFTNAYLIFDQSQYDKFAKEYKSKYPTFMDKVVEGESVEDLANKINVPQANLKSTIIQFNKFVTDGRDIEFKRPIETMSKFSDGKIYAIHIAPSILNTQGGAQRNEKAQVLDTNENPIPHLYSAGEFGGICVNHYQGGGNLAECLIFGKIAGEQAASNESSKINLSENLPEINDLLDGDQVQNIPLKKDQYLGSSEAGLGGKIVVRVTYDDKKIKNVEVIENHETEGIGSVAIKELPQKIVSANSTDVDAVSGASSTSRALKEAVMKAIKNADK